MKQFVVLTLVVFSVVQPGRADIREDWQKCQRVNKSAASAEAQYCAGLEAGRGGNEKDAVKLFRKAGDQNHPGAQAMLGFHYERGLGIKQDYAEAAKWYRKAAEQGHTEAMNNLGNLYRAGKGVPQNNDEAVKWYRLAAEHGNPEARANLPAIAPDIPLPPSKPANAEAQQLNSKGVAFLKSDPEMAVRYFERAQAADPAWGEPWCNHTYALFKNVARQGGGLHNVFSYLYRCYMLDPSLKTKYEGLFVKEESGLEKVGGLTIQNDIRISQEARQRIAAINDAEAAYQEGLRLRKLNTRQGSAEAAACHLRALQLNPMMAKARLARGKIFHFGFRETYPPLALLNYAAAIRLDPSMWEAYRYRSELWEQLSLFDMALYDESVAILYNPSLAILYANRAETALVLGKTDLAEADIKKGRQLDPQHWPEMERTLRANVEQIRNEAERARQQAAMWAEAAKSMASYERSEASRRAGEADSRGDHEAARVIREQARIP